MPGSQSPKSVVVADALALVFEARAVTRAQRPPAAAFTVVFGGGSALRSHLSRDRSRANSGDTACEE